MSVTLTGKKGVYVFDPHSESTKLGEGGMGLVYLGHETSTNNKVAIKILYKELSSNPVNIERALKESNINIDHENIIRMIEFIEKDGIYHIISEYLEGESLDQYFDKQKVISEKRVVNIASEVLRGLHVLHNSNPKIIHRDIKPSNIFLCDNGYVKIMDFGVARSLEGTNKKLTKTGSVVGTPYYAAPEQVRSQTELINATTDIYSLGVTMYELLTGSVPFDGKSEYDTLKMQVEKPLPPHPKISQKLFNVISKATAKNQNSRFKTAKEFFDALGPFRATADKNQKEPTDQTNTQPKSKSGSGAKVLNWIFIPLALGLLIFSVKTYNELELSKDDASYYSGRYFDLSAQNSNLKTKLSLAAETRPIIVQSVPIRLVDASKKVINDFEDNLYGGNEVRYVEPKVVYKSILTEDRVLKIHYKLYSPSGSLIYNREYVTNNPVFPKTDYSNYSDVSVSKDKDGEFFMGRFGNNYRSGKYRIEIWYKDNWLFTKYFRIY